MRHITGLATGLAFGAVLALAAPVGTAAEMMRTRKKVMGERRLDAALLDGLDAELAVSPAILDGAKKEGKVVLRMTIPPRQFESVRTAFNERYPFVKVDYVSAVGRDR